MRREKYLFFTLLCLERENVGNIVLVYAASSLHLLNQYIGLLSVPSQAGSNVKNESTNVTISFWKRNQNVLVSFPYFLVENRLFQYGPDSVLLDQRDMISFDWAELIFLHVYRGAQESIPRNEFRQPM